MTKDNLLESLLKTSARPPLFEPGEARFWDDPYISARLLEAHLDPSRDAASRKPETIDKEVGYLVSSGTLKPGDSVLDLGCGPGLYASRLAEKGIKVTGINISEGSLNYAIAQSKEKGLDIDYRLMNFLEMDFNQEFDIVLQTNGEINTFSDTVRDDLLSRIHRALKPGGRLVFDATTRVLRGNTGFGNRWEISRGGLWRPGPSLVMEQGFDYPEQDVFLNQYIVIDETGIPVTYRFWFHDYSLKTLRQILMYAGFKVVQVWNDLSGMPYEDGGEWLAVVAQKDDIRPATDTATDYKDLVRQGYDRLAADYDNMRVRKAPKQLDLLTSRIKDGAAVLDIGCGAGIPVAQTLAQRFKVTGVDISGGILDLARKNVPDAAFVQGDIMSLEFPPSLFDAAVAFYSIFHLPREEHPELLRRIHDWLKPGGYLLATLSYCDDAPYTEDYFGVTMYWSNYGLEEYKKLLSEAGFKILETAAIGAGYQDVELSPGEAHPLIFAQKS